MLHLLDEGLESLLRAAVPLSRDIDVSFDTPDDAWAAAVTKPTVDLFLYDVRRNGDRQLAGWAPAVDGDGRPARRQPSHHVDCRYLVTVWSPEATDQHRLLGDVLVALLEVGPVPDEHLPAELRGGQPAPQLSAAWPSERQPSEFWSALGGRLRPGIEVTVTVALDRRAVVAAGPPVERVEDEVALRDGEGQRRQRVGGRADAGARGGAVWTRRGAATVAADGTFLVPAEGGDEVWTSAAGRGVVPDDGVVVLDGEHEGSERRGEDRHDGRDGEHEGSEGRGEDRHDGRDGEHEGEG